MKRRHRPAPRPPGHARIRQLIAVVLDAHARGEQLSHHRDSSHFHPAALELIDLNVGADYALARRLSDPTPITSAEIDALAARFARRHD